MQSNTHQNGSIYLACNDMSYWPPALSEPVTLLRPTTQTKVNNAEIILTSLT